MAKRKKTRDVEQLSDEELLQTRVRDLNLQISGSWLESPIHRLYQELDEKGIQFHPPCYLADEWFCPDKVPIIGILFCLAHPRLQQLEQKMMYEVEGGAEQSCMKLLRHESGHAINYAYRLYKKTRWRELFGPFSAAYSDSYYYQPYSRKCVIHLEDNYAQSHPDEDFAETFAVWLTPNSNWRIKYHGWPVMKKLQYVDRLMKRIGSQSPAVSAPANPPFSASRMTSTLATYYERKRQALGTKFQGFYDDGLKEIFAAGKGDSAQVRASKLIRRHRRQLVNSITRWTGHRKYDIHQFLNRFIARCDSLELYVPQELNENVIALTALLTAIANDTFRTTGREKHR